MCDLSSTGQKEKRDELEQHRAALTNRLRAKTEQHAAAVAEVERAQDVIGALLFSSGRIRF